MSAVRTRALADHLTSLLEECYILRRHLDLNNEVASILLSQALSINFDISLVIKLPKSMTEIPTKLVR